MTAPIKLSGGFLNELSFIYLATAMIEVSQEAMKNKKEYQGKLALREADYHTEKQLDRRIEKLYQELNSFLERYSFAHSQGKAKRHILLTNATHQYKGVPNLDYLACWILYLRFQPNERTKPLNDAFKWIADKESQLLSIIELLGKTASADKDSEMYELANEIVREL